MRSLALLCALLIGGQAHAQGVNPALFQALRPILDLDFTKMATLDPRVSITRASPLQDWNCANPPVLVTFGNNVADLGACDPQTGYNLGLGVWDASTISNKWSDDLTQSAWTAASMTVTFDQTGPDGIAISASKLLATGPDATVVYNSKFNANQFILTAAIKCLVCTGEIDISADGGQNWQNIASYLSSNWGRFPRNGLYETTAGQPAFRVRNSGDAIAVARVNLEIDANTHSTAPTPSVTTGATTSTVRAADFVTIDMTQVAGWNPDAWIAVAQTMMPALEGNGPNGPAGTTGALNRTLFQIDNGGTTNPPNNVLYLRQQTDPLSNTQCAPATNPGVVPYCPDFNISALVNGAGPSGGGKTRCSAGGTTGTNQFQGLVNPIRAGFATNVVSYLSAALDTSGNNLNNFCNTGAGSGNAAQARAVGIGSSTFASGIFNRVVLGSSPSSIGTLVGPLNGYVQRFQIYSAPTAKMASILASLSARTPSRSATHPLLQGGGNLLYESGNPVICNGC